MRRTDLRFHKGDEYGNIPNFGDFDANYGRARIVGDAGDELASTQKISGQEGLFKNGMSLFDHGFELRVGNKIKADELIDWLKTKGEPYSKGLWPDGRKLEEVIQVAQ